MSVYDIFNGVTGYERRLRPGKSRGEKEKYANLTSEEILKLVKKNERIHCQPAWKWKGLIVLATLGFLGFIVSLATSEEGLRKAHRLPLLVSIILTVGAVYFGLYKQNKKAFSIRLNAFGMMVTNYSKKTWYPWRTISTIGTTSDDHSTYVMFKTGEQRNASFVDEMFGFGHTKLPKSYAISHDQMVSQMSHYKYQYINMQLYKHFQLEVEAIKEPQNMSMLWGRLGAKKKT